MKPDMHPETGEIDWSAFRARIAKAFDASAEALKPSDERARQILDERARHLARPAAAKERATAPVEIITFKLGIGRYGLETRFVQEVLQQADVTKIPGVSDFVLGVINVRGDIIPVFDLLRFFGLPVTAAPDRSRMIVIGSLRAEFGILVDSGLAISALAINAFQSDAKMELVQGGECVRGITRDGIVVLDGAVLLRDQRLFVDSSEQVVRRPISSGGESDA